MIERRCFGLRLTFPPPHESRYQHDKRKALRPALIKTTVVTFILLVVYVLLYSGIGLMAPEDFHLMGIWPESDKYYMASIATAYFVGVILPLLLFYAHTFIPQGCSRRVRFLTDLKHEDEQAEGKRGWSLRRSYVGRDNIFLRNADYVLLATSTVLVALISLTRWRIIVMLGSDWLEQSEAGFRTVDISRNHMPYLANRSTHEPLYLIEEAQLAHNGSVVRDVLLPSYLVHYQDCYIEVGSSDNLIHQFLVIMWLAYLSVVLHVSPHLLVVVVLYSVVAVVGQRLLFGGEIVPSIDVLVEGMYLLAIGMFLYVGALRNDAFMRREWQERTQAVAKSETLGKEMVRLRNQTGFASPAQLALLRYHFEDENLDPRLQGVAQIDGDELELGEVLGTGAFCEVYRGAYRKMPVAVKKVQQMTETGIKAFKAECALLHELRHPNIVLMLGAFWSVEDAHLCLVLEICGRGSLQGLLVSDESPFLSWGAHKLPIALGVAKALAYLHGLEPKIIHRDLKPANVLLDDGFNAKLADFGVSREEADATMTQAGTPAFAAPEMLRRERYTETIDTWAFGCILCCMWTHDARPEAAESHGSSTLYAAVIRNAGTGVLTGRGLDRASVSSAPGRPSATSAAGGKRVSKARVSSLEEMMHKVAETKISPRLPEESFLAELVAACCCPEPDLRPPMWDVRAMLDSPEFGAAAVMTPPGPQPGLPADLDAFLHPQAPGGLPQERMRVGSGGEASSPELSWANASSARGSTARSPQSHMPGLSLYSPRLPPGANPLDRLTHPEHTIDEISSKEASSATPSRQGSRESGAHASAELRLTEGAAGSDGAAERSPSARDRLCAGEGTSTTDTGTTPGGARSSKGSRGSRSGRLSAGRLGQLAQLPWRASAGRSTDGSASAASCRQTSGEETEALRSDEPAEAEAEGETEARECAASALQMHRASHESSAKSEATPPRTATPGVTPDRRTSMPPLMPGDVSPGYAARLAQRGGPLKSSLSSSLSGSVSPRRSVGFTGLPLDARALAQAKVEQRVIAVAQRRLEAMERHAADSPHDVQGDLHALQPLADSAEPGARSRGASGSSPGKTLTAAATSLAVAEVALSERTTPRPKPALERIESGPDSLGSDGAQDGGGAALQPQAATSYESPAPGRRGSCYAEDI